MNDRSIDWINALVVLAFGLFIGWSGLFAHGFWWTDESRHAMHGAFFVDFVRDLPFQSPFDYVQRYFAQYPALAFNWYLPFFPVAIGAVMVVAGVTETSAHAAVIGVWLFGVVGWYAWLSPRLGRPAALIASLALLSMPVVVLWGRSVMLEAPATGLCALGALLFQRYIDRPGHITAFTAGFALFSALLVKQTAIFILPVLLAYALASPSGRRALWRRESWWGIILVFLALSIIAVHAIKFGPAAVMSGAQHTGSGSAARWSLERWGIYAESIYLAVGPLISVLAVLGLILSLFRGSRQVVVLPVAWLVASYIWCTLLTGAPANNARYAFYVMPAVVFFAAYGIYHFRANRVLRWGWAAALLLAVGMHASDAIQTPHRHVSGYQDAAKAVYALPNSGAILFAGKHDGNFIFHLHNLDRDRQRVVLRGDKILVSMSVHKYFGIESHVSSADDIQSLLNRNGVRWIVVESRDLVGLDEFKLLLDALQGENYSLIARIPVETNVDQFKDVDVLIYENLGLDLPADGRIRIDYPDLGRSFEFTFPDAKKG